MGEIAEMMLDGTLDYVTGEYLGNGDGFPRTFDKETLEFDRKAEHKKKTSQRKYKCNICGRKIHEQGFRQHALAKHNGKEDFNKPKDKE